MRSIEKVSIATDGGPEECPVIVRLEDQVVAKYPELRIALVVAANTLYPSVAAQREAELAVFARVGLSCPTEESVLNSPYSKLYNDFYRAMGLKPGKVSTPPKQVARVLRRGRYDAILPVVDVSMEIEYSSLLSFQVYDVDSMPDKVLRFALAEGGEPIWSATGDSRCCKEGELALFADGNVIHSSYYGNSSRYLLRKASRRALVRVMMIPGIEEGVAIAALKELQARLDLRDFVELHRDRRVGSLTYE